MRSGRRRVAIGAIACLAATAALASAAGSASAGQQLPTIDLSDASRCDFIAKPSNGRCLMPFPDNYYTVRDKKTATGRRVNLQTEAMPANVSGKHIDAEPYNLNDGFSPGQPIVLKVPGLDSIAAMNATGAAPINHIGRFKKRRQPIVLIDAKSGKRVPIWSEIDSNASSPENAALEIEPAKSLKAKHRYIVALRNLKTADGNKIDAPDAFKYYRDSVPSDQKPINERRHHFNRIFKKLKQAKIKRGSLYLAWDFTVASDKNIAGRLLHMRDDAFAQLGDTTLDDQTVQGNPPTFHITDVTDLTPAQNANTARRVQGTVTVPCYLTPSCAPGGHFQLDSKGLPTQNGTYEANFRCTIPRSAVDGGSNPARPLVYGHGLFGSASEINSSLLSGFGNSHNAVFCATDEIGMSNGDLVNTAGILVDLSRFPELSDRVQQGLLNELYLGREMIHPDGFGNDSAFHVDGTPTSPSVIDNSRLYYNGNSQGGILGGALTAVAPDFTRAALGVPAMRYSLLLPRSVDYDAFAAVQYPAYPDELSRPLLLSLTQMLWDRSEPNGYARRMTTDPLPDTPKHKVLLAAAFGDHQVTNFATDVEARSIGASRHDPILFPGRFPGVDVLFGVPPIESYPFKGPASVIYSDIGPVRPDPNDSSKTIGVPPPPLTNVPNRAGEDPHGAPRGITAVSEMINQFLTPGGSFTDQCGGGPCYAGGFTGP